MFTCKSSRYLLPWLLLVAVACSRTPAAADIEPQPSTPTHAIQSVPAGDPVEGRRVATRVGCNGCHGLDAGGKVFHEDKEQGRIVAPNLTQRRHLYDDAGLAALLRQGRTHDGHVPWDMPIKMFQHLSDREVRDITAWLRSLPAVEHADLPAGQWSSSLAKAVADGTHPWLDDMRPDPGNQPPAAPPVEPLALGKHLALTTCGECHGWDLNGFGGDDAPPLVVAKAYSPDHFARLMKTGITATGKSSKTGLMTQMGRDRFSSMTPDEVGALKQFLDSR